MALLNRLGVDRDTHLDLSQAKRTGLIALVVVGVIAAGVIYGLVFMAFLVEASAR